MSLSREFHIGDIISVCTGMLVSPRHMDGVYELSAFMAGEPVWTHQLARVGREAAPVLLAQHPALAETFAEARQVTPDNWQDWLARWVERHGEMLPVTPMARDQHERIDPVSELAQKVAPERIVVVEVGKPKSGREP